MKKFVLVVLILIALITCFSGCKNISLEVSKNYEKHSTLKKLPYNENLYYDSDTKIVYFLFNEWAGNSGYGYMSAYYAPNGLPYIYDTVSNSLIEIDSKKV